MCFLGGSCWSHRLSSCLSVLPLPRWLCSPLVVVLVRLLSRVWLFATPWTVARQAPLSMGSPRQEHCSRLLFPPTFSLLNFKLHHHKNELLSSMPPLLGYEIWVSHGCLEANFNLFLLDGERWLYRTEDLVCRHLGHHSADRGDRSAQI